MVILMITKTISNTANNSVAISDPNTSLPEITIFTSTFKNHNGSLCGPLRSGSTGTQVVRGGFRCVPVLRGLTGDSRAAPRRSEIPRPRISTHINLAPGKEARFIYAELHEPVRDTFDRT